MDATTSPTPNSSLRERMLQDMTMRGFGEHTQKDYIRHVRRFAGFLGKPPDLATVEDLRRFQMDQHERAVGPASINGAVSALRFLFGITLKRPDMALGLVVVRFTPKLRVAHWPTTQCMPIPELNRPQRILARKANAARGLTPHEATLIRPIIALPARQRLPAKTIPKPLYP